ncbi:MAG: M24 family metallopeptidase [bacterium]|jgi:Xaa-Pro aminopeptidase
MQNTLENKINEIYNKRIQKIKEHLNTIGADAFLTNNKLNFYYLSNFSGSTGILIITNDENYLIVDGRYTLRAKKEAINVNVIEATDKSKLSNNVIKLLKELNVSKLAVEAHNLTLSSYLVYKEYFKIIPTYFLVENIRAIKDENEIELIKKAMEITQIVLKEVEDLLKNNISKITESEVAFYIKNRINELGGGLAFEPIVAFNTNTAFPHYAPSNTILKENDFIIIDMGATYLGYHSDITRSFCFGNNPKFNELYKIVLEAQVESIKSLRVGLPAKEAYFKAVKVFEKYNLENYFTHGLGHGVGLEIHELPSLSSASNNYLNKGNVITIEPGVYIEDVGGIRIEDLILIKEDSIEFISTYPK